MTLTQLKISLVVNNSSDIAHSPGQILTYQLELRCFLLTKCFAVIPEYCGTINKKAWLGLVPKQFARRQAKHSKLILRPVVVETFLFTTISWEMDSQGKDVRVRKDPWARFEAWRYHPAINKRANMRNFLPGFWWGVGAFVIAIGIEKLLEKPDDHGEHHWLQWILYCSKKNYYRFCVVKKLLYGFSERYFCTKEPGKNTVCTSNHSWNSFFRFSDQIGVELISVD